MPPDPLPRPSGTAYIQARVTGRWALSLLTEGWTDEECRSLIAGDEEARAALEVELMRRVLREPDGVDRDFVEMRFDNVAS